MATAATAATAAMWSSVAQVRLRSEATAVPAVHRVEELLVAAATVVPRHLRKRPPTELQLVALEVPAGHQLPPVQVESEALVDRPQSQMLAEPELAALAVPVDLQSQVRVVSVVSVVLPWQMAQRRPVMSLVVAVELVANRPHQAMAALAAMAALVSLTSLVLTRLAVSVELEVRPTMASVESVESAVKAHTCCPPWSENHSVESAVEAATQRLARLVPVEPGALHRLPALAHQLQLARSVAPEVPVQLVVPVGPVAPQPTIAVQPAKHLVGMAVLAEQLVAPADYSVLPLRLVARQLTVLTALGASA